MRPLQCKNNCPKIKICFGYVKLHDFLGNILCDCNERGYPGVYLQIYSYISAETYPWILKFGTIVLWHRTAQSIPTFILSSTSTSSHIFVGLLHLFCAATFSLDSSAIQPVLCSTCPYHLILLVRAPHPGPGCQALREVCLRWIHPLPSHYRSNGSVQVHYATDCSV